MGYNVAPSWKGTEYGYGMGEGQKIIYTPEAYQDTSSKTYYAVGEAQKKQL